MVLFLRCEPLICGEPISGKTTLRALWSLCFGVYVEVVMLVFLYCVVDPMIYCGLGRDNKGMSVYRCELVESYFLTKVAERWVV